MNKADELEHKRRVRGGHKGSAKKMLGQLDSELGTTPPDYTKVSQLKRSLEEKIDTIKTLDADILNLVSDEAELASEIELADDFKAVVYAAIIKAERLPSGASTTTTPDGPTGTHGTDKGNHVK